MNFFNQYFILWRFLFILFLAGQAPAQSLFPTEWKFELLKDESAEWWNTLRVNMVPGVSYTLQKSDNLLSWQNLYSQYGTDGAWICPLFKGVAPSLPSTNAPLQIAGIRPPATQYVWLVLQKDQTGAALISWNSLDDHSPKQTRLTAITLDPVWEEYDNFYLNQHNNHLFSISPMVYSAVTYTATPPILGTKDTAMLAALIASFPVITENIQHSVDVAAAYTPTPSNSSSGDRGFFRVAADWTLDSDGDGIYDWHELIFDGSNPFLKDTDGDGQIDIIQDNSGPEPTLDNSTRNSSTATALPPKAIIERNRIYAHRFVIHKPNDPSYTQGPQIFSQAYSEASSLIDKSSYSAFADGVGNLNLLEGEWTDWLLRFGSSHIKTDPVTGSTDPKLNGAYGESFRVERSAFRIRLEEPAPGGGYTIKLRLVSYRWSLDSNGGSRDGPIRNVT